MNSSMSGWSTSSTTIFAGRCVGAAHEAHRAARVATLGQLLLRRAKLGQVHARAGAAAEDDAFAPDPVEDRVHRVLDREDEARAALRLLLEADVEPDGRVEGGELVDEDRLELGFEGVGLLLGREVAVLAAPGGDRVDDAPDHLLDAALALGRGHAAAEVLLRDDVGGGLAPELRELDVLLVEDRLVLAGDEGVARLPVDLVEGVAAGDREVAADGESGVLVDDRVRDRFARYRGLNCLLCARHAAASKGSRGSIGTSSVDRGPDGSRAVFRVRRAGPPEAGRWRRGAPGPGGRRSSRARRP